ncbi:H-NS family nucleoid-associated regulatory protein [Cupriavidus sp. SW-Y-13]|uniref:H-NS family nucleoid-associated regulatory protein n=1 Tax=Cupriavidus sp. SW-Y-13 TaxID=2653854 RepID=UPI001365F58D|nr:H-NS family nucleoid-associated regulatory protein [Cupriavidus sp. SW-Y-13]MWL91478.1 H-NS histone family protein [Cupriavidus sp. SW-Y-13]
MPSAKSNGAPQAPNNHLFIASQELLLQRAKNDAVLWIRTTMARNGITFTQLQTAGCFETSPQVARHIDLTVKYKDALGHTWDGTGDMPEWLQRATHAGQSVDHFKVDGTVVHSG